MRTYSLCVATLLLGASSAIAQPGTDNDFRLVLAQHNGRLTWTADQFKITQSSAKPNGQEIGIRGNQNAGHLTFLGFLFLSSQEAPLTGAKCRDGALNAAKKGNSQLKVLATSEISPKNGLPVSIVEYSEPDRSGRTLYSVRGFVATDDICGDLEFYSNESIHAADPDLHSVFSSLKLDADYVPQFSDVFVYAQLLYNEQQFASAAPLFELALDRLKNIPEKDNRTARRILIDQAGMAYGISGNLAKARTIFTKAVADDPDYPMYYYNLACADAEGKNLAGAQKHLQEAFDRKANVNPGEQMPDPTQDASFTPYRDNKQFWSFIESLRSK